MKRPKAYTINVHIPEPEFGRLHELIHVSNEINRSAYVRRLINAEYERRHGAEKKEESEGAK